MRADIGRFFEGRPLATINTLKTLYDVGLGVGRDATVWLEGVQMVFGRGEGRAGRGFMRVTPLENGAVVAFPRGHQLPDPKKRARGVPGSETRMVVGHPSEVDAYARRMIDAAYALE